MLSAKVATTANRIKLFQNKLTGSLDKAVLAVAEDVAAYARDSMEPGFGTPAPPGHPPNIQTGELHDSIQASLVGPGKAEVQVGADYGAELEFGSARVAARPFLTPAVDAVQKTAGARVRTEVGRNL